VIKSKQIQRPKLVLVVDDQEINRDALEVIMEDDYEVITAENGAEALEKMKGHAADLSVVLLDLMMPVMSGYEVLKKVHEDEVLRKIPIIVLTADKEAELEALQLGAADFITKPFDVHEVIQARVGRIIELSEGRNLISAAERDPLTGLYSRNFFREYAYSLYKYHQELKLDAVVLNIDQFHSINALNGWEFGDTVLRAIGDIILTYLNDKDGIAGRLEADEFLVYCSHIDDYRYILERLQEKISSISPNVQIHIRMGVKTWQEGVEPQMLFDQARTACNMVRGDYQNPIMIYDDKMLEKDMMNRRLLNDLRAALEEGQFQVFYQPKYCIQCNPPRLRSAEALIRWKHPELGMISPGAFIPLFEGNGLISRVDSYVWKKAAEQIAIWKEKYNYTLPVSVNLSRADIFDPTLTDRLIHLIVDNGLEYRDIKLEVTESAYTQNAKKLLELINRLRGLGFEVEMDDFGSGYSSLNMLSSMPIDVLKMDMSFVKNIEKSETDLRLVKLIMDIARDLKLKVVAEGVETEGQMVLLKDAGCDLAQGYYFSRPVPAEEFEKLIERELELDKQ